MTRKKVLNSFALLAYLDAEQGAEKVKSLLSVANKEGSMLLMNEINIGEIYYIISRKRGPRKADYFLETVLPGLPIGVMHNTFEHIIEASKIKASYPLSFADCFSVITAKQHDAALVTRGPEFKHVEHIVTVEWLG